MFSKKKGLKLTMSKIILNQSVFSIAVDIEEFTMKKYNMIREVLKGYIIESMPLTEMFQFKIDANEVVCITRKSINYYIGADQYNEERVNTIIKNIFEVLELNTEIFAVIDINGKTPAEDSFVQSVNEHKEKFGNQFENLRGVGYRYFLKGEKYDDDLKKEPLISDPNFFYHQLTRNFGTEKVTVDYMLDSLSEILKNIAKYFK